MEKCITNGAVSDDPHPDVVDTAQSPALTGGIASHHRLVVAPSQPSVLWGNHVRAADSWSIITKDDYILNLNEPNKVK